MFQIVTFYRFIQLKDLETKRDRLKASMLELAIKGTVILAPEGFNSSLCGSAEDVEPFLAGAEATLGSAFEYKSSFHEAMPFRRVDVKIKPEIVTLKKTVDMSLGDGEHLERGRWIRPRLDPDAADLLDLPAGLDEAEALGEGE